MLATQRCFRWQGGPSIFCLSLLVFFLCVSSNLALANQLATYHLAQATPGLLVGGGLTQGGEHSRPRALTYPPNVQFHHLFFHLWLDVTYNSSNHIAIVSLWMSRNPGQQLSRRRCGWLRFRIRPFRVTHRMVRLGRVTMTWLTPDRT